MLTGCIMPEARGSTAKQRSTFKYSMQKDIYYCRLQGFESCFNQFLYDYAERLICLAYSPFFSVYRYDDQDFPEWWLIESLVLLIENYEELCRHQQFGAFCMILDCDYKRETIDPLLHYMVDNEKQGREKFLANIIAGNLKKLCYPVGAFY